MIFAWQIILEDKPIYQPSNTDRKGGCQELSSNNKDSCDSVAECSQEQSDAYCIKTSTHNIDDCFNEEDESGEVQDKQNYAISDCLIHNSTPSVNKSFSVPRCSEEMPQGLLPCCRAEQWSGESCSRYSVK